MTARELIVELLKYPADHLDQEVDVRVCHNGRDYDYHVNSVEYVLSSSNCDYPRFIIVT